jgi:hypothetical protein
LQFWAAGPKLLLSNKALYEVNKMTPESDTTRLIEATKQLRASIRKFNRWAEKQHETGLTPKRADKIQTEMNWLAMEIDKEERAVHAAAVDCGVADLRDPAHYADVEYRPSGFHYYTYTPAQPRKSERV